MRETALHRAAGVHIELIAPGVRPPTVAEARTVTEGQLGHPATIAGVAKTTFCRHGHPQAFMYYPGRDAAGSHFNTGLCRLSCPWLVQAVDQWEKQGAVRRLSEELLLDPTTPPPPPAPALTPDGGSDDAVMVGGSVGRPAPPEERAQWRAALLATNRAHARIRDELLHPVARDRLEKPKVRALSCLS